MIYRTYFISFLLCLISLETTKNRVYSAEPSSELEVGVMPFTLRSDEHETTFPLRLTVTVNNLSAVQALDHNKSNLHMRDSLRRRGKFDTMTASEIKKFNERYPSVLVPAAQWGSAKAPLASLIKFEITDGNGKLLSGNVRPLTATRDLKGPVTLDGVQIAMLEFGLDPDQMKSWPKGLVHIKAKIDGTAHRPGAITISFKDQQPWFWQKEEKVRRTYLEGLYYRIDAQWNRVETAANVILALKKDSPFGFELKGEAALANKKYREAEQAFAKAMAGSIRMQKEQKNPSPEFPSYHAERLRLATYLRMQSEKLSK
jgi:hypothetical protein